MLKEYATLLPHLRSYRYRYVAGILCLIVVDASQVLIPRYIQIAIDRISSGAFALVDIIDPLVHMLLLALLISIGRFFWRYFINIASRRIEAEMRDRLFSHILSMSGNFFRENTTGDLMARATNDISTIRQATGMGFVSLIDGIFMTAMIIAAMFLNNSAVAAWIILPLPLITALILLFGRIVGRLFKKIQDIYGYLSNIAQESLSGIRIVKSFVKEDYFYNRFSMANTDYKNAIMDLVKTSGFFFPFITFLSGLSTILLIIFGGRASIRNKMTPGSIIAMLSYLEMLVWPLMSAGFTVNIVQRGAASLKRINQILRTAPEIKESSNCIRKTPRGDIDIKRLYYIYPGSQKPALKDISVHIPEGSMLGILGKVGSGKSTLLKILPRMLEPGEGHVFIGNIDIWSYGLRELRSAFGMVPQESFLFSDTIEHNILFSAHNISPERFKAITKISGIDHDYQLFPDGWETVVGERGITLSGGQKQRIALARALAADPNILLLDDALSAVDAQTEEHILSSLIDERKAKTTIIVSHRISTLRNADYIIVLDSGEIIQQGSHEELMAESEGFYARIAALQQLEQQVSIDSIKNNISQRETLSREKPLGQDTSVSEEKKSMDEYFDAEPVTKGYDAQIARRILLYLKPYGVYAIIAILALAIATTGELISPTIIRRAIDDSVVRDWYGLDPSALSMLPGNDSSHEVEIGGRIYVRSSNLAGLTMAERDHLREQGLLDNEASYVFPLDPMRDKKLSVMDGIPKAELSDKWGVIPSSVLRTLKSEDAAILRAADDKSLLRFGFILLVVLLIVLGATFAMTWFTNQISTLIMKDMRLELFHHVMEQSLSYLSRQPVGRLVTRLTSDIEVISQFFSDVLSAFIKDASIMIGSLIVLFLLSWKLALIVLTTMPFVFIAAAIARIKARDAFRNQRYWTSKVNSYLSEHISGIDIVKLFVQEDKVSENFSKNSKQLLKANIAEMYVYATFRPFVDFMATLTTVLAIFFGAILFLKMQISIGTLIAFISLISMFYSPIKDLSEKYILLQSAMASGERIFGLLDQDERFPDQLPEFVGKPFPRNIRGHIELSHVWFAYKNEEWVLKDVSFIVNPGEKVAIVGYTGAGKSTIANLLARFWDIQKGSILIDGVPIGQFPLKHIRKLIQSVPQDVFLFQGTIRENISLGLDLSQEKLEEATKAVYAHDFISSLAQGYDTPLSEGGLNLSLGQRQLISFARVLAHEPSVIILDEATSSIDTETEKLLQRGIEGLLKGHTSIVIAHRLSTIRDANRIIVLGQGRVAEIGTHDELIALHGLYWNLYRLQNKEME